MRLNFQDCKPPTAAKVREMSAMDDASGLFAVSTLQFYHQRTRTYYRRHFDGQRVTWEKCRVVKEVEPWRMDASMVVTSAS